MWNGQPLPSIDPKSSREQQSLSCMKIIFLWIDPECARVTWVYLEVTVCQVKFLQYGPWPWQLFFHTSIAKDCSVFPRPISSPVSVIIAHAQPKTKTTKAHNHHTPTHFVACFNYHYSAELCKHKHTHTHSLTHPPVSCLCVSVCVCQCAVEYFFFSLFFFLGAFQISCIHPLATSIHKKADLKFHQPLHFQGKSAN